MSRPNTSMTGGSSDDDADHQPDNSFNVANADGEREDVAMAKAMLLPDFRHALSLTQLHGGYLGKIDHAPGAYGYAEAYLEVGDKAANGELAFVSRMLAAQAVTLDNVFAEMTRRMASYMANAPGPTETYARIALKAQANSRATLEALTKLHQPREQTVRHVHVNEGGQAVIADHFHHHTGVSNNGKHRAQPHATGTGAAGASPALPSPDPLGDGVSIASRKGERTLQDARRQGQRRARGNRNAWKHGARSAATLDLMAMICGRARRTDKQSDC